MTHSPKPPSRADALAAFKEYMAMTGLTPQDEQKRRYENICKCRPVIEAALATDAPIVEGLDEALKIYDRQVHPGLRNDAVWLHPIVEAARLYAQGRTQSAVPEEVLEGVKRCKAFSDFIFESLDIDAETTSITIQHPTKGDYPIHLKEVQDGLEKALNTLSAAPTVTGGACRDLVFVEKILFKCQDADDAEKGLQLIGEWCVKYLAPPSSAEKEGVYNDVEE